MDPELLKRIDTLGEKLGATGAYLWEKLVHGEVVVSTIFAVGLGIMAAVVAAIAAFAHRRAVTYQPRNSYDDAGVGWRVVSFVGLLGAIGLFMGCMWNASNALAPERAVIQSLFGK